MASGPESGRVLDDTVTTVDIEALALCDCIAAGGSFPRVPDFVVGPAQRGGDG